MPDDVPAEIRALADARAAARRDRDWAAADALRDQLLASGWKVVDTGTLYDLERAAPPDEATGDVVRYGSSASVPSRLEEPPSGVASIVLVATDWPDDVARAARSVAAHAPAATQVVVVANDPSGDQAAALDALDGPEVVRTSARLGWAAALNAGVRRATAPVVILLDTSVELTGDLVTPLVAALDDPVVAVAGPFGIVSDDLRRFREPEGDAVDVDAIEGYAQAFRRTDYVERGPLDEYFAFYRNLDIWWSLVLRDPWSAADGEDETEDDADDVLVDVADLPAPRRAVRVATGSVTRHEHRGWTSLPEAERDRLSKKNFYRVLKRFATRRDLLVGG